MRRFASSVVAACGEWMPPGLARVAIPIAIVGRDARCLAANEAFAALIGRAVAQVIGSLLAEICSPDDARALERRCQSLYRARGSTSWYQVLRHGAGVVPVVMQAAAVRDDRGQQALLFIVHRLDGATSPKYDDRVEELVLVSDLRDALRNDGLQLFYQPIVNLSSGAVTGVEALLRWTRPGSGPVSPDVFVPAAERAGLSADLDHYVLQKACKDFRVIAAVFGSAAKVSVNISAQNLSTGLERSVGEALSSAGMAGRNLVLEITERAVITDPEVARVALERLRRRNVVAALDDFGTGYSSLGHLARLPVAGLKIDRLFVRNVTDDQNALALTSAIIEMARALGLDVVAEGVERPEQLEVLRQLGCLAGQGFLWSPAVALDDLPDLAERLMRRSDDLACRRRRSVS
jgi:PAS domain S-box-containing protein